MQLANLTLPVHSQRTHRIKKPEYLQRNTTDQFRVIFSSTLNQTGYQSLSEDFERRIQSTQQMIEIAQTDEQKIRALAIPMSFFFNEMKKEQTRNAIPKECLSDFMHEIMALNQVCYQMYIFRECDFEVAAKGLSTIFKGKSLANLIAQGEKELDEIPKCFSRYRALFDEQQAPESIQQILTTVKTVHQPKASNKNITIVWPENRELQNSLLDKSSTWKPFHWYTVLFNLVDNAIKYSPNNSKIDLSITKVKKNFVISIQDQGMGIPKDQIAQVLSGQRGTNAIESGIAGTGFGLKRISDLVQKQKGTLQIESSTLDPTGTTITITIPANKKPA